MLEIWRYGMPEEYRVVVTRLSQRWVMREIEPTSESLPSGFVRTTISD